MSSIASAASKRLTACSMLGVARQLSLLDQRPAARSARGAPPPRAIAARTGAARRPSSERPLASSNRAPPLRPSIARLEERAAPFQLPLEPPGWRRRRARPQRRDQCDEQCILAPGAAVARLLALARHFVAARPRLGGCNSRFCVGSGTMIHLAVARPSMRSSRESYRTFCMAASPSKLERASKCGGPRFMQKAIRAAASADERARDTQNPNPNPWFRCAAQSFSCSPRRPSSCPSSIFETHLRRPGAARAARHGRRRRQGARGPAHASKPEQAALPLRRVEAVALDTVPAAPRPAQNRGLLVSR